MSEPELKPCPFCGNPHPKMAGQMNACYVKCDECGQESSYGPLGNEAAAKWNRRASVKDEPIVLKACPLCEGAARWGRLDGTYFVECEGCGQRPNYWLDAQSAARAWNNYEPDMTKVREAAAKKAIRDYQTQGVTAHPSHPAIDPAEYEALKTLVIGVAQKVARTYTDDGNFKAFVNSRISKLAGASLGSIVEASMKAMDEAAMNRVNAEPEIKPCPFCGENARATGSDISGMVSCINSRCAVRPCTSMFGSNADAIKHWNRRA
jgi:hypothetical protein